MDALAIVTPDDCCSAILIASIHSSKIGESARWECPECGLEWRRELYQLEAGDGMYLWAPFCPVLVFKP